jgi:outer membrane protein assembly factor BamA
LVVAFKYRPFFYLITLFLGALILFGCNPTKYVPEDKYLLNSVKIKIDSKGIKKDEIKGYIKQKPNKRILGFKFHLGIYNLSNPKKEKGISKYLRKIGEEPSVWDPYNTKRSVDQLKTYLRKKGYYYGEVRVKDSINLKRRKVKLTYYIKSGEPIKIRSLSFSAEDSVIRKIFYADTINTLIKRGANLDEDVLTDEKKRLVYYFMNKGYYNFNKDIIHYNADTVGLNGYLEMDISANDNNKNQNSSPYNVYSIRNVTIETENNNIFELDKYGNKIKTDTIESSGLKFIYRENFYVKPKVILQSNYILPGKNFRIEQVDATRKYLYGLNVFGKVDIQFTDISAKDTSGRYLLDCNLKLKPLPIQSSTIEVEGTNSSGNLGAAANWVYQNRSLFGNAESFIFKVRGALEAIKPNEGSELDKTVEYGVETGINLPKFLLPLNSIVFIKKYNPKTSVNLAYNYQKRPDLTRTVANISFGYNWKQDWHITHYFNPIEFNYVDISNMTQTFRDIIKDKYIENSYTNHLVPVTSYSLIINTQNIKKASNFHYFRLNVESAGNLVTLINKAINSTKHSDNIDNDTIRYYKLFGTRYSQYLKADIDFRHYHMFSQGNSIVYRFFAGVAYPYGNAKSVPFEKQYFSGGANSIRGWQVRSLGPGSYREVNEKAYPNSIGDIKLEANIEYRFKLIWILNGAIFTDVGNVWAISEPINMPEAGFKWNGFIDDLAVGSGFGLRFDLKFFLFRTDLGLKMRDPSRFSYDRWIFQQKSLILKDFALSIAIAYPF